MSQLSELARALGGKVLGAQVLCPGPGHSAKDRSLSVRPSMMSDDGFVVFSHAGDDPIICKNFVRAKLGRPNWKAGRRDARLEKLIARRDDKPVLDEIVAKKRRVLALWNEGRDPRGTVVEAYLRSRQLDLPGDVAGEVLRFHPVCPWMDEQSGEIVRVPAMIAAMRNICTDEITGAHVTALTTDAKKIDRRMRGIAAGAAIKLTADENVTLGLHIGEGIETCLTALQIGFVPVWAMASVGGIASFPALDGIECLTILAEAGEASRKAIQACGKRWKDAGREVLVCRPRAGSDLNDALREIGK
ncbi:MAG: toprim domain-containing protein [Methylocella sp.]